jgi:hypothetical protein
MEKTRTYLVLDPQNNDAGFNPADEAELWLVNEESGNMTHSGAAEEDGKVNARVSVNDLLDACASLFDDSFDEDEPATYVSKAQLEKLQSLLAKIEEV